MNQVNQTSALNNPIVKGVKKLKADTVVIGAKTADLITASTKKQLGVVIDKSFEIRETNA